MPKKVKRRAASVNPAAAAWTREEKVEKLRVVLDATLDALEVPPAMQLRILADCAERIHARSKAAPYRPTRDLPPEFKALMAKGTGKGSTQAEVDDVREDRAMRTIPAMQANGVPYVTQEWITTHMRNSGLPLAAQKRALRVIARELK